MSRFYASIQGNTETEATRRGTAKSGISGHIRGWDIGIAVKCHVDDQDRDIVTAWVTPGSTDDGEDMLIGQWARIDGEYVQLADQEE